MPLEIVGEGPEETFAPQWDGCKFLGDPTTVGQVLAKVGDDSPNRDDWGDIDYVRYGTPQTPSYEIQYLVGCGAPYRGTVEKKRVYPCGVWRYNWDGGWGAKANVEYFADLYVGDATEAQRAKLRADAWDNYLKIGGQVFNVTASVLDTTSKIYSSVAKNDYKKDMNGASDKFAKSQTALDSAGQNLNTNANGINAISESMSSSGASLANAKQQLDFKLPELNSMLAELNRLKSGLEGFGSQLNVAKNNLAYASNRGNFPSGIAGANAQRNAIKQANAQIASISKSIVDYESAIYDRSIELKNQSDRYNEMGAQADAEKNAYLQKAGQLNNALSERKMILNNCKNALNLRNEAMNDVQEAQNTLADKMETSVDLASGAMGASGVSDAIKYVRTGEYFNAGGAILSSGANIFGNYTPEITPYQVFIQSAIIDGMYTLQANSGPQTFARKFAESTLMLESALRLTESFAMSFEVMEADPYFAFQNMAVETHAGVGIIGRWLTVASPFIPGGAVVSPILPVATQIAQKVASGAFSTAVELGKKVADDKWSTKIGSGEPSVLTTGLAGIFITLTSPISSIFGKENPAIEIQRMAMTGSEEMVRELELVKDSRPQLRFSVDLYPTRPDAEPWGWGSKKYGDGNLGDLK
jgi:hypothetical protein